MPSPVVPSDFCELVPTPTTPPCDALKRLFFDFPDLLCTFFSWMFNANGTISEAFRRELNAVPAGLQAYFGGLAAPEGWLFCNGTAYKQADYPYLYAAIGVRHGAGNGIDEFQVPDLGRKVVMGIGSGLVLAEEGGQEEVTLERAQIPSVLFGIHPDASSSIVGDESTGYLGVSGGNNPRFPVGDDDTTTKYGRTLDPETLETVPTMMPFYVMTPCIKT